MMTRLSSMHRACQSKHEQEVTEHNDLKRKEAVPRTEENQMSSLEKAPSGSGVNENITAAVTWIFGV